MHEQRIQRIEIYSKNGNDYMRGFKIFYRDGTDQVINSVDGTHKGTVNFEETDVLVGMTIIFTSESDKRPRKLGFTINRNGSII